MSDINESVSALITKEGYINGENAKVAPFAYDAQGYADESQQGIEGVTEYSYENSQNIPVGNATTLETNTTTLSKGLRAQASSIPRQIVNHFFGRTSFNLNKIHEWFLSFLNLFRKHLKRDNNQWSPTAKYEEGDVCFVNATITLEDETEKKVTRSFRCIKGAEGGLVNVPPVDEESGEVNTDYWQECNVFDSLYVNNLYGVSSEIADGSVTTEKIADGAVTKEKLAPGVLSLYKKEVEVQGSDTFVPFSDFPGFTYSEDGAYSAFCLPPPGNTPYLTSTCDIGMKEEVRGVFVKPRYIEGGEVKAGTVISTEENAVFGKVKFGEVKFNQKNTQEETVTVTVVIF